MQHQSLGVAIIGSGRIGTLLAVLILSIGTANGAVTEYPTKPIRMIVGFSAGGGSDFAARIAGQKLTETASER